MLFVFSMSKIQNTRYQILGNIETSNSELLSGWNVCNNQFIKEHNFFLNDLKQTQAEKIVPK